MSRKTLLGFGAFVLFLLTGWALWPRQSKNAGPGSDDTIKIVQNAQVGDRLLKTSLPLASASYAPNTVAPEQDRTVRILDDEGVQDSLPDPAFDPRTLYRRVRSEARDNDWAGRSEKEIQAALIAVPYVARGDGIRVSCASTMCEVRGSIDGDASPENTHVAMEALQGDALHKSLAADGLEMVSATFGGKGKVTGFTVYARRR